LPVRKDKPRLHHENICINNEMENHIIPTIVAVVSPLAYALLVYLLFTGADWLMNSPLGSGAGHPSNSRFILANDH
jgi:hypothetical protein